LREFAPGIRFLILSCRGTNRRIVGLGKAWWYGMALSHDGKLLFSLVNSAGSNLMLVENFR
jgi:hypothetical protein